MDSSHSFKMKAANNMKTMYMGSVYSMDDPKKGDYVVDENELKKIEGENIEIIPGTTTTKKETIYDTGKSLKGLSQEQLDWRTNKIKELGGLDEYHRVYGNKEAGKAREVETTSTTPDTEKKTLDLGPLERQYQTGSNFQRRQQIRGVIQGERKEKRAGLKTARIKGGYTNEDGSFVKFESGKKKREYKKQLKGKAQENKLNRIAEINRQTQLQEEQGFIGPGSTSKQLFTPSTAGTTSRDTRKFSQQTMSMNLSPKAMSYFNKKKKK